MVPKFFLSDSKHPYEKNDVLFVKIGPQEAEILHFKDFDFSYKINEFNILSEIKSTAWLLLLLLLLLFSVYYEKVVDARS
jgi:hypothetical protein